VVGDAAAFEALVASEATHRASVRHAANPASLKSRMPEIGTSGSVGAPSFGSGLPDLMRNLGDALPTYGA
jgi:hypothetical protein